LTGAETKVYLTMLAHAHADGGKCHPSMATLREETGLGRETVAGAIRALTKKGLVRNLGRQTVEMERAGQVVGTWTGAVYCLPRPGRGTSHQALLPFP